MFHSLFSRFPHGKASVFTDVKELNEERINTYLLCHHALLFN